jgi:outer membrane protein OmpA-like peptidoglycan-associated protein
MKAAFRLAAVLGFALLAACSNTRDNLVVVIPEPDGHVGAVTVQSDSGRLLLDQAYAAAGAGSGAHAMKAVPVTQEDVRATFSRALDAQPIPPKSYILYFERDSDTLTKESKAAFEAVFTEIARRQASEIVVTGHTDMTGALDYNDKLSLERAKAVRKLFLARGLPEDSVLTAGRGKREPLVKTADNVAEARNRRVEITVR